MIIVCAFPESRRIRESTTMRRSKSPKSRNGLDVDRLRKLKALKGLSPRKLKTLLERMKVRRFVRRSAIYQGDQIPMAYLILGGVAKLTCLNRKGRRNLLEVLGPGDIIEIPSLLPDTHHHVTCEAFTDCEVGLFNPRELIEDVVGVSFRDFNEALNLTVERWWHLLERQSNFLNQTVEERVALALHDMSGKFGVEDDRGMIINLSLTHKEIAELVDCSRPKVSQCIRRLARGGALIRDHRRLIVDRAKIRTILRS